MGVESDGKPADDRVGEAVARLRSQLVVGWESFPAVDELDATLGKAFQAARVAAPQMIKVKRKPSLVGFGDTGEEDDSFMRSLWFRCASARLI